jgi:Carbohydrate binding module (family 6)
VNFRRRGVTFLVRLGSILAVLFTAHIASGAAAPHLGSPFAVPGLIQAADFDDGGEGISYHDTTPTNQGGAYRDTGVDIQISSERGYNIGWTNPGEWLQYTIAVAAAGAYRVDFRVASAGQGGRLHLEVNGMNISGSVTVPNTGGWQTWTTISATVTLSAGQQAARLVMDTAGLYAIGNIEWMRFTAVTAAASTPYGGTPWAVPGSFRAANFDNGGEGVAYHDSSAGNAGSVYRQTDVDLQNCSEGGVDVGWVTAGEWLKYTVRVASSGQYRADFRVASAGQGGRFHLEMNGVNVTGSLTVPDTGGWQNWRTVSANVTLTAGQQFARLVMESAPNVSVGNFEWIQLTATTGPTSTAVSGTPAAIPGTIQAENFDAGGEGVAYHDTTSGNSGGVYRQGDVDLEPTAGGGYDIGWTAAGEWLKYTVSVAATANYIVRFRVASLGHGGTFHLEMNGTNVTGTLTVPDTGGWQNWQTVAANVSLTAGQQVARLVLDTLGTSSVGNFDWMQFTAATSTTDGGSGSTISVPAGGDVQAAINAAKSGDTILLTPGATYTGNLVLPDKVGTSYITIRSAAADSSLPPAGVRIGPQYASALPKIQGGIAGMSAFMTAAAAHHWRLQFLEIVDTYPDANIIELGDGSGAQNSLAVVPHDLVIDRCYIHGSATAGQKRGIALNSASTTIVNSYISDIKSVSESQAIAGWNGPGPYTITNNYLEATGENFMLGGSDPWIPNLVPSDVTFTQNYVSKQVVWRGQGWTVKNLIELKNAQRVVFDGNVLENNWQAGQVGYAVMLTPRNQDGRAPWSTVQHIRFTNNVVRHVAAVFDMLGTDNLHPSQPLTDVVIRNNLFVDVSAAKWGGNGQIVLTIGGSNITIDHNTAFTDGTSFLYADSRTVSNFVFTNNIMPDNKWGIMGSGASPGNGTIAMYYPGSTFLKNVFIGSNPSTYPAGNFYPTTVAGVGFIDPTRNYRLSSSSPYRQAATDGTAIGCNIDALNAAARTQY